VEYSVHLPCRREVKVIGIWGYNLGDFEGALSSRGQFLGREVYLQVTKVEPNLCSYFPGGELRSNPFFNCLSCLSMGGRCLFASSIEEFKSFIEGREECLPDWGVSSEFKTHHEQEQCLVGDRVSGRVVRKLGHQQKIRPFCGLTLEKDPEIGFQLLVNPFRFAISDGRR